MTKYEAIRKYDAMTDEERVKTWNDYILSKDRDAIDLIRPMHELSAWLEGLTMDEVLGCFYHYSSYDEYFVEDEYYGIITFSDPKERINDDYLTDYMMHAKENN